MKLSRLIFGLVIALNTWSAVADEPPLTNQAFKNVEIFKSNGCACCSKYATLLRAEGIAPIVRNTDMVRSLYEDLKIPEDMRSCHILTADGYLFSGHIPASDIKKVLEDKPNFRGLLTPGMAIGSPGMEIPGHQGDNYKVYSLGYDGELSLYSEHGPEEKTTDPNN